MNKIFAALLMMFLVAGTASAALQYKTINSNIGTGIALNTDQAVYVSALSSGLPAGITEFGYYVTNSSGQIQGGVIDLSQAVDGKVFVGNFEAGDQIAFWMKNENGEYIDSIYRDGEKGESRQSVYVNNNGSPNATIAFNENGGFGSGYGPENLGPGDYDSNFVFEVSTGNSQPSGQPLPGLLASLAAGAAVLAGARRKRKNRI